VKLVAKLILLSIFTFQLTFLLSCKKNEGNNDNKSSKTTLLKTTEDKNIAIKLLNSEIKTNDSINIQVIVKTHYLSKVIFPETVNIKGLELIETHNSPPQYNNDKKELAKTYIFQPNTSGQYSFPSLNIKIIGKEGNSNVVKTPELPVNVKSLFNEESPKEIMPFEPPIKTNNKLTPTIIILIVLSLVIILFLRKNSKSMASDLSKEKLILSLNKFKNNSEINSAYELLASILTKLLPNHTTNSLTIKQIENIIEKSDHSGELENEIINISKHLKEIKFKGLKDVPEELKEKLINITEQLLP
jgi:hypothetical protein